MEGGRDGGRKGWREEGKEGGRDRVEDVLREKVETERGGGTGGEMREEGGERKEEKKGREREGGERIKEKWVRRFGKVGKDRGKKGRLTALPCVSPVSGQEPCGTS